MTLNCLSCGGYASPVSPAMEDAAGPLHFLPAAVDRNWSGDLLPPPFAHLRSRSMAVAGGSHLPDEKKNKYHRMMSSSGGPLLGGISVRETETAESRMVRSGPLLGGISVREAATAEPRLVRSRGMRRDWSFEDLRNRHSQGQCRRDSSLKKEN